MKVNVPVIQSNPIQSEFESEYKSESNFMPGAEAPDKPAQPSLINKIFDLFNQICISYPKINSRSEAMKKTIKARLNNGYTLSDFERLFEKAELSDFLKGKNNRDWSATFDWLIKEANMAKVLNGNYDNKENTSNQEKHSYCLDDFKSLVNKFD